MDSSKRIWRYSYDFDTFTDTERQNELKRLNEQANIARAAEIAELKKLGLGPGKRVLEIGCGPGFITAMMAEECAPAKALGLDASEELLDAANRLVKPKHDNLSFMKGDAYETGLAPASYDFIYNRMIYQHLSEPLRAAKEAKRLLAPGGKIVIADVDAGWQMIEPTCPEFDQLNELACRAQIKVGGDRFIGRKLPETLTAAGFKNVGLDIATFTSLDIDPKKFLDVTTRFKAMQVGTAEAMQLLQKIDTFWNAQAKPPLIAVSVFFGFGTA